MKKSNDIKLYEQLSLRILDILETYPTKTSYKGYNGNTYWEEDKRTAELNILLAEQRRVSIRITKNTKEGN